MQHQFHRPGNFHVRGQRFGGVNQHVVALLHRPAVLGSGVVDEHALSPESGHWVVWIVGIAVARLVSGSWRLSRPSPCIELARPPLCKKKRVYWVRSRGHVSSPRQTFSPMTNNCTGASRSMPLSMPLSR